MDGGVYSRVIFPGKMNTGTRHGYENARGDPRKLFSMTVPSVLRACEILLKRVGALLESGAPSAGFWRILGWRCACVILW